MKNHAIVIVEGNEAFRSMLATTLREKYYVRDFADSDAAILFLKVHEVHLVLYGVNPDRLEQEEFIKILRKQKSTQHLPVIALVSREEESQQKRCYCAGVDMCLIKPFGLYFLSEVIGSAIRNRELAFAYSRRLALLPTNYKNLHSEDEEFINKVNHYIRDHIADLALSVAELADLMSMSFSQLDRKIFRLTGMTPKYYIREFRLKAAYQLLFEKRGNVSEVAMLTGFRSVSYFSTKFKIRFGFKPSSFRLPTSSELLFQAKRAPMQVA